MELIRHHKDRRLEWWLAWMTFGFGLFLADGRRSMDSAAFEALTRWMIESDWAMVFVVTGAFHLISLGINGRAWWTPFVRAIVTTANSLIYASFGTGFWLIDERTTGVYAYSALCVAALICIYGAIKDCCSVWGSWRDGRK